MHADDDDRRSLTVAMLSDALYEDAAGGSRRVVKELAEGLTRRGHRVLLIAPRYTGDEPARYTQDGVQIRRYGHGQLGAAGMPRLVLGGRRALDAMLQEGEAPVDVLHVHFAYSHLPAFSPRRALARATVRTFYGPWADEGLVEQGPRRGRNIVRDAGTWLTFQSRAAIERRSLGLADGVIALSAYSRRQVDQLMAGYRGSVALIPGGVDHTRFTLPGAHKDVLRRTLGLPDDGPLVLTVRRLVARMGLDRLIAALAEVARAMETPPHLVIVGRGQQREQLEEQACALGVARWVHFAGAVEDALLPIYYQAADLFVLPTRALEGFGLITLEALASGLPVLGTPVGATPELLAQIEPRLILRGSAAADIAHGMIHYFRHLAGQLRPELLRELVLRRYTWDAVVEATECSYRQVLKEAVGAGEQ
jgi:glycosyltransferase involved in cell wall biosynthesis